MKKGLTEMVFVLDRSGSMGGLESDTIGGFNSMIHKQKQTEGDAIVTTMLFDHENKIIHDRFNIQSVGEMTEKEYYVRGSTALLDAMGSAIQKTVNVQKHLPESERAEKVVFVIITDGHENASAEYSYKDIKRMVERQQKEYGWEFMFLGANIDAVAEGGKIGIRPERAVKFCCDSKGTALNYSVVSKTITKFRACENAWEIDDNWKEEIEADYKKRGRR